MGGKVAPPAGLLHLSHGSPAQNLPRCDQQVACSLQAQDCPAGPKTAVLRVVCQARACIEQVCLSVQLSCWRAHPAGISSVRCAPAAGLQPQPDGSPAAQDLLLLASHDCTVSLWTLQGGLVGVFGKHIWNLADLATWQDPKVSIASSSSPHPSRSLTFAFLSGPGMPWSIQGLLQRMPTCLLLVCCSRCQPLHPIGQQGGVCPSCLDWYLMHIL